MSASRVGAPWPVLLVMAACAAAYIANLGALQIGQHVDDAVYVSIGRSLAAGLGYVHCEDPRHPVEPQYPPALPVLIALVLCLGGGLETLRIIPLAFSLASLPLADAFFRSRLRCAGVDPAGPWRWLLLALFGMNHLLVGYAGMVMAEAPFVCLTLATLVLLSRVSDDDPSPPRPAGAVFGLALVLAVACLFRTSGLALVVGAAAWLLSRGRRREACAVAGLTALLLAPWLLFQRAATGQWFGAGYGVDVVSTGHSAWPLALRPLDNLLAYSTRLFPEALLPCFGERMMALLARVSLEPLALVMGLAVTVLVVTGAVICARRRSLPDGWLAASVSLLLLLWPYRYTRFALPLIPVALVYLLTTGTALAPRRRGVLLALGGLVLAGFVLRDVATVLHPPRADYPDLHAAGEFVSAHTEPDALIVAGNAPGLALYAPGRMVLDPEPLKGVAARYPAVEATVRAALSERPVYVLVRGAPAAGPDRTAPGAPELIAEPTATDPAHGLGLYRLRAAT